jgi:hypothetical protein
MCRHRVAWRAVPERRGAGLRALPVPWGAATHASAGARPGALSGEAGEPWRVVVSDRKRKPPSPAPGSKSEPLNDVQIDQNAASDEALARAALREVAASERAPASARAAAARTLLEAGGLIGRLQEKPRNSKGLNEMTRDELEAEIARLRAPASEALDEDDDPFAPTS